MLKFSLAAVLLLACLREGYGACGIAPLKTLTTPLGQTVEYCEWEGKKIGVGSSIRLVSAGACSSVSCTKHGMQFCGGGVYFGLTDDCEATYDACNLVYVKKDNPLEVCKTSPWKPSLTPSIGKK
ncbi:uncharacterized protein LOC106179752 [Lingula anatina]|uniref:Uncharacterized protein LOC106179752 n=1 Tax=Lingula anatina TaxID=7574 RepID=A0A1S3K917_LINAN|nr:uncharacterized protein LOC106179752 [Lingula anatina]|eukprot:XP_013418939.1 uncharacterized protein LOC106179752 [Lingula anatina]